MTHRRALLSGLVAFAALMAFCIWLGWNTAEFLGSMSRPCTVEQPGCVDAWVRHAGPARKA